MNNLHYIGRRISSFELYDELGPITGVSLLLDDESEPINAGDATGYVLEISCPYGTQIMATEILSAVQGRTYKGFRAENAILDPLAELGDYLSIGGSTFLLAHRIATFGPGHMSEVSAPGENELEHEYAWVNPEKKEFNQKISYVRSEISKNSGEIELLVERTDELGRHYSSITQSVGNITLEVQGLRGNFSSLSVEVDGIRTSVSDTNGRVSDIEQEVDGIRSSVRDVNGRVSTIEHKVDSITLEVTDKSGTVSIALKSGDDTLGTAGTIDMTGLVTFTALKAGPDVEAGQTFINGGWIGTDTLQGKTIKGATYYDDEEVGRLRLGVKIEGKENYPWLVFDAENKKKEVKELFSVAPIRVDYGWVAMTMLETTVLTVVDGVVNPTAAWNMSRVNMVASSKNYGEADPPNDAVEGQVYFKLIS